MPTKRVYYDRQPKVGDKIVAIRSSAFGYWEVGYEFRIVKLGIGYVVGWSDRQSFRQREAGGIPISDNAFKIFEDVVIEPEPTKKEKLKESHEYVYRILGVPLYKKTIKIYDEQKKAQ